MGLAWPQRLGPAPQRLAFSEPYWRSLPELPILVSLADQTRINNHLIPDRPLHSRALAASTAHKLAQDNGISHDNVMRIGR